MTETAGVYNVGVPRPQSKPSFELQLDSLPPDVRSVAESLAQYLAANRGARSRFDNYSLSNSDRR